MKYTKEIAFVVILIALGGVGLYIMKQPTETPPAPSPAEQQASVPATTPVTPVQIPQRQTEAEAAAPAAAFDKKLANELNSFLRTINDKATEYRNSRKVLNELVKPENLRDASYVDQNYEMMKGTIPALHMKIDDIMGSFDVTETKVRALSADQPVDVQARVQDEWSRLKESQASLYVSFFEIEDQILQTYDELMTLYHTKKDTMSYDMATAALVFQVPEDQKQAETLRTKIKDLYMKEADLLSEQ